MKTDDLISMLARDAEPAKQSTGAGRVAVALATGLAVAVAAVALTIGVRPDIGTATWPVLMKAGFSAAAAAVALPLAVRLMKPGRPLSWRVGAVFVFVGVSVLAAVIALMGVPGEMRLRAWMGGSFPWCLVLIPVLAAPTAAGLAWVMRAFAPTRLTLSGAAIGAVSGGIGAMAYAAYCPVDSVAFVTTWYVLAIALCATLGAFFGSRALRW